MNSESTPKDQPWKAWHKVEGPRNGKPATLSPLSIPLSDASSGNNQGSRPQKSRDVDLSAPKQILVSQDTSEPATVNGGDA